jgi:hypothetical protein
VEGLKYAGDQTVGGKESISMRLAGIESLETCVGRISWTNYGIGLILIARLRSVWLRLVRLLLQLLG